MFEPPSGCSIASTVPSSRPVTCWIPGLSIPSISTTNSFVLKASVNPKSGIAPPQWIRARLRPRSLGSALARARTAFLLADRDDHGLGGVARIEEDLRREDALLDVLRRV